MSHQQEVDLDVQIARRVFGLRVDYVDEECSSSTPGAKWHGGSDYYTVAVPYLFRTDDENEEGEYLPAYSVDIAAAWEVVEKVGADLDPRNHVQISQSLQPKGWNCWIGGFIRCNAPTAPEAICQAALRHVESAPAK
jgi:hypothetical protein